jgi:hypothetical protein
MKKLITTTLSSLVLATSLLGSSASAAGSASLNLSPNGGTYDTGSTISVTVSENSGNDSVNVIQADVAYNGAQLQFISASCNGAFEIAASVSANGITCGTTTPKTGGQIVGTMNFKALASGPISFAGSSAIYRSTDNTNVWNGNTTGGNYTVSAPVVAPVNTPAPITHSVIVKSSAPASTLPVVDPAPTPPITSAVDAASIKLFIVTIKVVDYRGNDVKNASVLFNGKTATSDKYGKVSFNGVTPGTYTVGASYGAASATTKITVNVKNKSTQYFMVKLPHVSTSHFGFLLGTGISLLIVGGGAFIVARNLRAAMAGKAAAKKPVIAAARGKKATPKKATKPSIQLATAKR